MRPPLGIDKRVMGMQDVDSELIYAPGKDNADPLDYLSRHPLPEKGKGAIKSVIKYVLKAKHVVLEAQIKEETCRDTQFQKLKGYLPETGNTTKRTQILHRSTVSRMSCMQ